MTTSYLTVAASAAAEIEVKRSRFVCLVEPVATETAARAVVEEERCRHRDARHHCSAFVLGPGGQVQRSSDDGEPPGTAGAPMLEVLRGHGVSDVVAVVSRYFGGVLLGAGGLVRAYSDAVRAGLEGAGVRRRRLLARFDIDVPLGEAGRLEHTLRANGIVVLGVEYGERAVVHLAGPVGDDRLPQLLAELTGGGVDLRAVGSVWADD